MEKQTNTKVWFITGASRGFGRIWAEAALERGDKVAATARNVSSILALAEKNMATMFSPWNWMLQMQIRRKR